MRTTERDLVFVVFGAGLGLALGALLGPPWAWLVAGALLLGVVRATR